MGKCQQLGRIRFRFKGYLSPKNFTFSKPEVASTAYFSPNRGGQAYAVEAMPFKSPARFRFFKRVELDEAFTATGALKGN